MSKCILRVFAVAGLLSASAFTALSASDYALHVHVPFDFVVGQSTLPAGDYVISQDGLSTVVTVQNWGDRRAAAVISAPGSTSGSEPRLVFKRVNGHNVLSQIQLGDRPSRTLPAASALTLR